MPPPYFLAEDAYIRHPFQADVDPSVTGFIGVPGTGVAPHLDETCDTIMTAQVCTKLRRPAVLEVSSCTIQQTTSQSYEAAGTRVCMFEGEFCCSRALSIKSRSQLSFQGNHHPIDFEFG